MNPGRSSFREAKLFHFGPRVSNVSAWGCAWDYTPPNQCESQWTFIASSRLGSELRRLQRLTQPRRSQHVFIGTTS